MLKRNYLFLAFVILVLVLTLVLFEPRYTGYVTASALVNLSTKNYSLGQAIDGFVNISYKDIPADTDLVISIGDKNAGDRLRNLCTECEIIPASYVLKDKVSEGAITFNGKGANNSYAVVFSVESPVITKAKFNITGDKVDGIYPMLPSVKMNNVKWSYAGPLIQGFEDVQAGYLFDYNKDAEFNINGARETEYCEQLDFPVSGRYRIDAYIKKLSDGATLYAGLRDKNKDKVTIDNNEVRCQITADSSFGWKSCQVDIKPSIYYACVYADSGDRDAQYYQIGVEKPDAISAGLYCSNNDCSVTQFKGYDYFIKIAKNKFVTNLSTTESIDFSTELAGTTCPVVISDNCLYPVEISSEGRGKIKFKITSVTASPVNGELYNVEYAPDMVSGGNLAVDLASFAELITPSSEGNYKIKASLEYNGKVYVADEEDISVVKAANIKIIAPQFVGLYQETPFRVEVKNNKSAIARYDWDFGEGDVITTFEPNSTHTYNTIGDYNVSVIVVDAAGLSSTADAVVHVNSAQKNVEYLLNDTKLGVNSFKSKLSSAPQVVNDVINILGINILLDNVTGLITQYELGYSSAFSLTDAEKEMAFGSIQSDLLTLRDKLPKGMVVDSLSFTPSLNYVDDIPDEIATDIDYKRALFEFQSNVNVQGNGYLVDADYISGREDHFVLVKKSISLSNSGDMFAVEYIPKEVAGSISAENILTDGYEIVNADPIIKWPISGSLDIVYRLDAVALDSLIKTKTFILAETKDLGVKLTLGVCGNNKCEEPLEDEIICPEDCKKKLPITFYIILLIVLILGIYYINFYKGPGNFRDATNWLSVKLFKRRIFTSNQDLENLQRYVRQTLSQGMSVMQIRETLLKKGWTNEQIDYIFKEVKK